jgi:2,6-dihydroxypseudooxynicotine hydrolase
MCHHVGEMMVYSLGEIPGRHEVALKCAASYRRVAEYFDPPSLQIEVPFGDHQLPGYLRVPRGVDHAACVILTGGANSVKEELHPVSDQLLARGLATFAFEGPGQGEYFATTGEPLRAESFVRAVSAVIDMLEGRPEIDSGRIGICGRATSGLLVIRAAAEDKRLAAVVAHPGSFDWAPYFERQFPFYPSQLELFTVLGARSISEGLELVKQELVLGEHLAEVRASMLVVNSADDRAIPASEGEKIKQGANTDVELVVFPGRAHGGPAALAIPLEADWLAERLAAA